MESRKMTSNKRTEGNKRGHSEFSRVRCEMCGKKPVCPYISFPNKALQPTARQVPQFLYAVAVSGG